MLCTYNQHSIFTPYDSESNWGDYDHDEQVHETAILEILMAEKKKLISVPAVATLTAAAATDPVSPHFTHRAKVLSWNKVKGYGFLCKIESLHSENSNEIEASIFVHQSNVLKPGLRVLNVGSYVLLNVVFDGQRKLNAAFNVMEL
jgi:cold shock CspA family protein